jgi:ABC-type multidrug transport system fused ATPase/permease subunit
MAWYWYGLFKFIFSRFYTADLRSGLNFEKSATIKEVRAMSLLIGGIISVILGLIGFFYWWSAFITILQGGIPIMLILGGILALYVGMDALHDKMREEQKQQEEKLSKAHQEIEQVKALSEQYREELERLKGQVKNTP